MLEVAISWKKIYNFCLEKPETSTMSTQTEFTNVKEVSLEPKEKRSQEECVKLLESEVSVIWLFKTVMLLQDPIYKVFI